MVMLTIDEVAEFSELSKKQLADLRRENERLPADQEQLGAAYKQGYEDCLNDCIRNGGEKWARSMFALAQAEQQRAPEPVAWTVENVIAGGDGSIESALAVSRFPELRDYLKYPLYTAPQAEQQNAEPVAWIDPRELGLFHSDKFADQLFAITPEHHNDHTIEGRLRFSIPLYTHPAPMTEDTTPMAAPKDQP